LVSHPFVLNESSFGTYGAVLETDSALAYIIKSGDKEQLGLE